MLKKSIHRFELLLSVFLLTGSLAFSQPVPITLMSWNIRYDNPNDGLNQWDLRKEDVVRIIFENAPDFIGVQEALPHQLSFLSDILNNYSTIGIGREQNSGGEHTAILYNITNFNLLKSETFWLSPTPEIFSKGWDAALPRICTYGLFAIRNTEYKILILNTHLDHMGAEARKNSAQLILDTIENLCLQHHPEAIVLFGDFNDNPDSKTISILAGYFGLPELTQKKDQINWPGTFNDFNPDSDILNRIDFIFTKQLEVIEYWHIPTRKTDGLYPSDHLPVLLKAGVRY